MIQGSGQPDPSVWSPVILPPEILDNILERIPADNKGRLTLIACASVATWFTGPSQRRLFSSVNIHQRNYKRWMSGAVLSESKAHLLEYVRSLSYSRGPYYEMRDLPRDSGKYSSALRNLRSLTLCNIAVGRISEEEFHTCFSAFRETLTRLSLDGFTTSFCEFVTLVGYFPNITTLQLRSFRLKPDEGPVPPRPLLFRGKLRISVQADSPTFLNRFARLGLEYEELVIDTPSPTFSDTKLIERVLRISASTIKFLRLTAQLLCE